MTTYIETQTVFSDPRHPRNPWFIHRICGVLVCCVRIVAIVGLLLTSAIADEPQLSTAQRFTFSEIHMGAPWKIVLYAPNEAVANRAAGAAYARIEELNRILSDYDPASELSRLSATSPSPAPIHISHDLWRVLEFSQRLSEKSGGAFDITIGPLTKLWRHARREKEFPREDFLTVARESTDYRSLRLDPKPQTAQLMKPNMRLDAGGIGMGYGVDEALKVLRRAGIPSALIDASGDIGVSEAPPGERGWRIGIEPPSGEGPPTRYVLLENYAITTSGDAFQAVELNGKRSSHVIDPRTGLGVIGRAAVTVIAPDCTTADSYTKPICVLGPEEGFKLIEATPGAAAFVMRQIDGQGIGGDPNAPAKFEIYETSRFKSFVTESKSAVEKAK
jgi:thiamine biosynthesis lipoprotein